MTAMRIKPVYGWGWQIDGVGILDPPAFALWISTSQDDFIGGVADEEGHLLDKMYVVMTPRDVYDGVTVFHLFADTDPSIIDRARATTGVPRARVTGFAEVLAQ
jgi:hypothetical protein